jgi:hypothetical protein
MAIKRKENQGTSALPEKLEGLLLKGFSFQAIRDNYEDAFKAVKSEVVQYLEKNDDGFDADLGKGFKCDQGTVIYQARANWNFDKDKIIELVKTGKMTIETLVNLASFNAEKLKTAIGEPTFNAIATNAPTESLTFRGSSEFKAECAEKFSGLVPIVEPSEEEEMKPKIEKAMKRAEKEGIPASKAKELIAARLEEKSSLAKAKAAAALAKSKVKSADQDLDDILKS